MDRSSGNTRQVLHRSNNLNIEDEQEYFDPNSNYSENYYDENYYQENHNGEFTTAQYVSDNSQNFYYEKPPIQNLNDSEVTQKIPERIEIPDDQNFMKKASIQLDT